MSVDSDTVMQIMRLVLPFCSWCAPCGWVDIFAILVRAIQYSVAVMKPISPRSPLAAATATTALDSQRSASSSYKLWLIVVVLLAVNGFIYLARFSPTNTNSGVVVPDQAWHAALSSHSISTTASTDSMPRDLETNPTVLSQSSSAVTDDAQHAATTSGNTQKKYNVLIFYPDDWRHDTLGVAGTQPVQTPFLDELSRTDGKRFTHNCVTTSICWISRATMFTGQYYSRHLSRYIRQPVFYDHWNETYIYTMQQHGYYVGHIGKWQFRNTDGFVNTHYNWTDLYEGVHWHTINREKIHSTVRDEQNAIRFLRERPKDAPFVLTTAFYAPKAVGEAEIQHSPMDYSEPLYANVTIPLPMDAEFGFQQLPQFMQDNWYYLEGRRRYKQRFDFNVTGMYERFQKRYYRMVTEVDNAIKNVVDELKAQGELDNTIIIMTTGTFSV
jgi:Sulfatase